MTGCTFVSIVQGMTSEEFTEQHPRVSVGEAINELRQHDDYASFEVRQGALWAIMPECEELITYIVYGEVSTEAVFAWLGY